MMNFCICYEFFPLHLKNFPRAFAFKGTETTLYMVGGFPASEGKAKCFGKCGQMDTFPHNKMFTANQPI